MKTAKLAFKPQAFDELPTTFDGLIRNFPPRPIHDRADHENAVGMIDALAGHNLNKDQEDYLEVLATLVERYESETLPKRPRVTGLALLRYLLEEHSLTGDDLAKIISVHRSVAYRILKGERGLTTDHLKALSDRFGVPVGAFVR